MISRHLAESRKAAAKVQELEKANTVVPDAIAQYKKGLAFAEKEDWGTAIACYFEAIRIDPDYGKAYLNRAIAYYNQDKFDEAIADYTQAIRIDPDFAIAYRHRGRSYLEQGNTPKAAADFAKAKELGFVP